MGFDDALKDDKWVANLTLNTLYITKREREKVSAGIPLNIDCEVIDIVLKIRH